MDAGSPHALALVVTAASALVAAICALFAALCLRKSRRLVAARRSETSTLAELHEIRDYLVKVDAWSKRLNSRLAMQERRESGEEVVQNPRKAIPGGSIAQNATKADVRRFAMERGMLDPGKPPRHA